MNINSCVFCACFRHGVIDRPDPHRVDDKARLQAQIEMDHEIQELRNRQQKQVLDKPNMQKKPSSSSTSSSKRPPPPVDDQGDEEVEYGHDADTGEGVERGGGDAEAAAGKGAVVVQGGYDSEYPEARQRRDKIKEVGREKT